MASNDQTSIKPKIMFSFGLIVLAVITATVIAYFSISRLMQTVEDFSQPNEMVAKIDSILVTISETENVLQEYSISKGERNLENYYLLVNDLDGQINRLQVEAKGDSVQLNILDSISTLLSQKLINFEAFRQITEQRNQFDFYQKMLKKLDMASRQSRSNFEVLEKIQRQPPVAQLSKKIEQNDTTKSQEQVAEQSVEDTLNSETEEDKKKGGLLGLIGRIFPKKKDESDSTTSQPNKDVDKALASLQEEQLKLLRKVDELQKKSTTGIGTDSLKQILDGVKYEQSNIQRKLDEKELSFLGKNAEVMRKIHNLVNDIEKHQKYLEDTSSEQVKFTLKNSVRNIAVILVLAFASTGIFIYLIFTDISRSEYYKKELLNSKIKAEEAAKVKENFLANMSHEIRTPLTAILGFTEQLVKSRRFAGTDKEYLNAIDHSSEHLLSIVNDILDLSKLEANQVKLENEGFDIISVLAQIYSNLKYQADKKKLGFHYQTSGNELRLVKGDAFRLKQILFNLVSNAIKFTEKGEVNMICDLSEQGEDQIQALITVQDSGIGIPQDRIESIFENFNQADASTTRKFGGTGLGLAISRKLVLLQGGKLHVSSEMGQGSTFTIEIMYKKASAEDLQIHQEETITFSDEFAGKQVLVIDDDTLNTHLTEIVLQKWQLQTTVVHRGKEALEQAENQKFDLILSDLQMPEMSGEEIAEAIRKMGDGLNRETPIIAFTANIYRKDWSYYDKAGFNDYLLKPFSEINLYQILKKFVAPSEESLAYQMNTSPEIKIAEQSQLPKDNSISNATEHYQDQPLYSLKTIRLFTGDDSESLANFLEEFIQTNQYSLNQLKLAVKKKNAEKISFHAHKMLPNLQNLQAHSITSVLRELELVTPETYNEKAISQVQQVIQDMEDLLEAITDEISFFKEQT